MFFFICRRRNPHDLFEDRAEVFRFGKAKLARYVRRGHAPFQKPFRLFDLHAIKARKQRFPRLFSKRLAKKRRGIIHFIANFFQG